MDSNNKYIYIYLIRDDCLCCGYTFSFVGTLSSAIAMRRSCVVVLQGAIILNSFSSTRKSIDKYVRKIVGKYNSDMPLGLFLKQVCDGENVVIRELCLDRYDELEKNKISEDVWKRFLAVHQKRGYKSFFCETDSEKVIVLNRGLREYEKIFSISHELGHMLLPWHKPYRHPDRDLSMDGEMYLEADADHFAYRLMLMFRGYKFSSSQCSVDRVSKIARLAQQYGSSFALRFATKYMKSPVFGIIRHPHEEMVFIVSQKFQSLFPHANPEHIYSLLNIHAANGDEIVEKTILLHAEDLSYHHFLVTSISNTQEQGGHMLGLWMHRDPPLVSPFTSATL